MYAYTRYDSSGDKHPQIFFIRCKNNPSSTGFVKISVFACHFINVFPKMVIFKSNMFSFWTKFSFSGY